MALLNNMKKQQDPDAMQDMTGVNDPDAAGDSGMMGARNPDAQGDAQSGKLQQVVNGMINKLFTEQDLQALINILQTNAAKTTKPVVDAIVGGLIGLLKQGREQGKVLPVKVIMTAVIPVLIKIAQGVESEEQRASALLAELIGSVGQQLAMQGSKAGVLDQQQVAEMKQLVNAFVSQVSKHFSDSGNPQDAPQVMGEQPEQSMMR